MSVLFISLVLSCASPSAYAEGTVQFGFGQLIVDAETSLAEGFSSDPTSASFYVDILSAGEVINVSLCGSRDSDGFTVDVFAPSNDLVPVAQLTASRSNVSCDDPFDAPLTQPLRYVSTEIGAYRLSIENTSQTGWPDSHFNRFDISVTPDSNSLPDPTLAAGRLWAYTVGFNAQSFASSQATDADLYVLVPGGRENTHYIWRLDLNNFAGYAYNLLANSLGVDSPFSRYSVQKNSGSAAASTVQYQFPQYLGLPAIAQTTPEQPPLITHARFRDLAGIDYTISPHTSPGREDTGTFTFTTDVEGTYSILIDLNQDGVYGNAGDRQLLGAASPGQISVPWDGRDAAGNSAAIADYYAQIKVNMGEYHFIANDVETSGGDEAGLTIFQVDNQGREYSTAVFWDDITLLPGKGGTSNTPMGGLSGTPEGSHTWGDFTWDSIGNENYIDTYVYGMSTTVYTPVSIADDDEKVINHDGILTVATADTFGETVAISLQDQDLNTDPTSRDTMTVELTNPTTADSVSIELLETDDNSGVFFNAVNVAYPTSTDTHNDGNSIVVTGDTLVVSYLDLATADGVSTVVTTPYTPIADSDNDGLNDHRDTDDDNDGLSDELESLHAEADSDGDGIANHLDKDSDDDSIPDAIEGDADHDGDGLPDYIDQDSDNDSIPDSMEAGLAVADDDNDDIVNVYDVDYLAGVDLNIDGIDDVSATQAILDSDDDGYPDFLDSDSDNDGIADAVEGPGDSDDDGLPNYLDLDSDNDLLADSLEANISAYVDNSVDESGRLIDSVDTDANGQDDRTQIAAVSDRDTDGDGQPDRLDIDSDNDQISDLFETLGKDDDLDGRVDRFLDTDTNGYSDLHDARLLLAPDTDLDGLPDRLDADADNDGIHDIVEGVTDHNADGIPDYRQRPGDSDADGIADSLEAPGDSDADGIVDRLDTDSDNDGISDRHEAGSHSANHSGSDPGIHLSVLRDSDNDGISDHLDLDSDNDGLPDAVEAGNTDLNYDGIVDEFTDTNRDGRDDRINPMALFLHDFDGDGVHDYRDLDSDNDGLTDARESFGITFDQDGDGHLDAFLDTDSDGMHNAPEPALLAVLNSDGDNFADYLDLDSDNDGLFDLLEAGGQDDDNNGLVDGWNDTDGDGIIDSVDADLTGGLDRDLDGIDDRADSDFAANAVDRDADGIIDTYDPDFNGDGLFDVEPISGFPGPDTLNTVVPEPNQSPDVAAANTDTTILTGLNGGVSGCSVGNAVRNSAKPSTGMDPLLFLLLSYSLVAVLRRHSLLCCR